MPDYINSVTQAVDNIRRLNAFLTENPNCLKTSVTSVRRWYAAWIDGVWQFGFSKFIGYAEMTPEAYAENRHNLSGGETEGASPLRAMSIEVADTSPLHQSLSTRLNAFLSGFGRDGPRPDATIRVLLTPPEAPQAFILREECEKAAWQNGFRRPVEGPPGWTGFASTTVPGMIHLAGAGPQGPWYLALDQSGVIEKLALSPAALPGPGLSRHAVGSLRELYDILSRVYRLSASLHDAPLREFEKKIRPLPQTTEAERLVVQRIGQDIFRASLLDYWQGTCPLTGITDLALLRASHIVPWRVCSTDAQRLDVHNGLLLSVLWDAAFDQGLVTFSDDGTPVFSAAISEAARRELRWSTPLTLTIRQCENLSWHRMHAFCSDVSAIVQQNPTNSAN